MNPAEGTIVLKPGREKSVKRDHPWIFSGAVASKRGLLRVGSVVDVLHTEGSWLGRGLYHPEDDMAVRLYTRDESESLNVDLFRSRLDRAIALRRDCGLGQNPATTGYRVCFSEADGLSGLIVDRFGDLLVVQVSTMVLASWIPAILDHLKAALCCGQVHVMPADAKRMGDDAATGALSNLSASTGEPVEFHEHGLRFEVDPANGQKTGFYLDQRCNRRRVAKYAEGRKVLSVYSYTGAFEVAAAKAGADHVIGVDSSEPALAQAARHADLNEVADQIEFRKGDAPKVLRSLRDSAQTFDMVILDPPRFVSNRHQMEKGLRAYKDINLLACKLLKPGGLLATFSCSGHVQAEQFQQALGWAGADADKSIRVLETLGQPADHPYDLRIPETRYLKGLICTVG